MPNLNCYNCHKTVFKRPADLRKIKNNRVFCNKSCAATYNNTCKLIGKKLKKQCKICKNLIYARATYCRKCYLIKQKQESITSLTLKQYLVKYGHLGANKYANIRLHARKKHKGKNLSCINCYYDKHVEIAHKKPINTFKQSSLISEINDDVNLVALCRNCHWEFDHGLLKI